MVPMVEPLACTARIVHDLTATPSTSTVQAPHCPVSQPTCVPVRRRSLRMNSTSRVRGSTCALTFLSLTVNDSETGTGMLLWLDGAGGMIAGGSCGVGEARILRAKERGNVNAVTDCRCTATDSRCR